MTKDAAFNLVDIAVDSIFLDGKPYLEAKVTPRDHSAGKHLSWEYEIIYEKKILFRSERTTEPTFRYPLKEDGLHLVRIWAFVDKRGCSYTQRGLHFYSENLRAEYQSFLDSIDVSTLLVQQVPLFCPEAPHQNIAAVVAGNAEQRKAFLSAYKSLNESVGKLHITEIFAEDDGESSTFIISQRPPHTLDEAKILFSGKALCDNELIVGYEDIRPSIDVSELLDSTGNFSAFSWDDERLVITSDYYGLSRLTYYESTGLFAVANSYHLLLMILVHMDVQLELLETIPIIPLLSEGGSFLQQRISHSMDIRDVYLLPIDSGFTICPNGEHHMFRKTLGRILNSSSNSDMQDLNNQTAAREITRAIDTMLTDGRYISTRFDLTGGKDSRIIFAGVEKLGRRVKSNLQIYFKKSTEREKQIVCRLKNTLGVPWDTMPEERDITSMEQNELAHRSLTMGLSYSRGFRRNARSTASPSYACIQGGGGGGLYRPHYALSFSHIDFEASEAQIAKNLLMYFENNALFSPEKLSDSFEAEICDALHEIGGISTKERFNNHYIYFRNSTHFGTQFAINSMFEQYDYWQPLMAKSAIKVLHSALHCGYDLSNQIEITRALNSHAVTIPYENVNDQKIQSAALKPLNLALNASGLEAEDDGSYEEAALDKRRNLVIITPEELRNELNEINSSYASGFFERFKTALKKLLAFNDGQYESTVGLGLYLYIKRQEQSKSEGGGSLPKGVIMTYNKLVSIIDQIEIIFPNKTWEALSNPTSAKQD